MNNVPVILQKAKELKEGMSDCEWRNFLKDAKRNSHIKIDLIARKGAAVLDEYSNSEEEQFELLQRLSSLSPPEMPDTQKFRLSNMLLSELVNQKKLHLKRNFEKEAEDEQNAMEGLISAAKRLACKRKNIKGLSKPPPTKRGLFNENKHPKKHPEFSESAAVETDRSKIKSILKKKKNVNQNVLKKVHFKEGNSDHTQPLTVLDRQQALTTVEKLWNMTEISHYIIARVSSYNVTDDDFKSLSGNNWLTDQVVDAYLAFLVQAEIEKGKKITMYASQTMTAIVDGSFTFKGCKKKLKLFECSTVIGAVVKHGHWTLIIVEPQNGIVYFYNPLMEKRSQILTVKRNWCSYVNQRMIAFNEVSQMQWQVETKMHSRQTDGYNCGVHCLLFAEQYLSGQPTTNHTRADLTAMRRKIDTDLMMFEIYLTEHCPGCGLAVFGKNEIKCQVCKRSFHRKNHCVGEDTVDKDCFVCKLCEINFWGCDC
ncbi:uncharacterized protein LOC134276581 isoform X2 [Saccostrea cucullata]|uniref:uncharacterized protein LOC134276581 isoform X2 n=1 Tax=Saccostrea cuccullata TaxID=36930 RepID=UPI002ED28F78